MRKNLIILVMKNNIPILITAKDISVRCPGKNLVLFEFLLKYYLGNYFDQIILISNSKCLIDLARENNIKSYYHPGVNGEFQCAWDYLKETNLLGVDSFILLPLTQPLREVGLVDKILEEYISDYDFITTYTNYPDRKLFEVTDEGDFKYSSPQGRLGRLCGSNRVLDGALYRIKIEFLNQVINSPNHNIQFWSGNFKLIENRMPFLDIDTPEDLEKLQNLIKLLSNIP